MKIILYSAPYYTKHCQCTFIGIEGVDYTINDKRFRSFVADRPMAQWLLPYTIRLFHWRGILAELLDALNDTYLEFDFYGLKSDFEVFYREIRIQEQSLTCEYATALQINAVYGGNPCNDVFVKKHTSMLAQIADAFVSSNIAQLIQTKRNLQKMSASMDGQWVAQSDPTDGDKQLLMEAGLTTGNHEGVLGLFILDGNSDTEEQAVFCIKHASHQWGSFLHNARVYVLIDEQQNGKDSVDRLLSIMREKGYLIKSIVAVTAYQEIVNDINSANYLSDYYIPQMVGKAIDALITAWSEIPSHIANQELREVQDHLAIIQRPCDWITSFAKATPHK